ncbi:MAG: DUF58 domain-containing protein [Oscillospiraceae bacterium]|jgi:hypothetical protein|nr:DUF58 domain-containing protein [Oscillospiraceae bacterium]
MKKQLFRNWILWFAWLLMASVTHLFGNNAATLAVLLASVLTPPILALPLLFAKHAVKSTALMTQKTVCADETLRGFLRIRRGGFFPAHRLFCVLHCENRLTCEVTAQRESCGLHKNTEMSFCVTAAHHGQLKLTLSTCLSDLFGLFVRRIPKQSGCTVTVLPKSLSTDVFSQDDATAQPENETYSQTRPGFDFSETYAIREYVNGDPVRSIHWKLSQKTDRLMVREYGLPISRQSPDDKDMVADSTVTGLSLQVSDSTDKRIVHRIFRLLLSAALLVGIGGSILHMTGRMDLWWVLLPAVYILSVCAAFCRSKKTALWFHMALGAVLLLAGVFGFRQFADGGGTFLNRLFVASETRQAYLYDRFTASGSDSGLIFFLLLLCIIIAVLCAAGVRRKNPLFALPPFLLLAGTQIYLGVFPGAGWILLTFAAFALLLAFVQNGKLKPTVYMPFLILVTLITVVTLATYPGANKTLAFVSESIRDRFDEKITTSALETQNIQVNPTKIQPDNAEESTDGADAVKKPEGFVGAHLGTIQQIEALAVRLLILFIVMHLLVLLGWLGHRRLQMKKYRARFHSPDTAFAIKALFDYLIAELKIFGLITANKDYSEYGGQITQLLKAEHFPDYQNAVGLWQEAVFSDHSMTEQQRTEMQNILNDTFKKIDAQAGVGMRCRLMMFRLFGKIGGKHAKKAML